MESCASARGAISPRRSRGGNGVIGNHMAKFARRRCRLFNKLGRVWVC